MQSVIVATTKSLRGEFLSRLLPALPATHSSGGSIIVVETHGTRVYIAEAPSVAAEYEPTDLAQITDRIPNPFFYSVEFSDPRVAREVLLLIADDSSLLVDNDHGLLLPGHEFARRLRLRPDWEWGTDDGDHERPP